MELRISKDTANKIYDLLVQIGGAQESERGGFIVYHTNIWSYPEEWRFMGKLGFGGKYYININKVDCYLEDDTPETIEIKEKINQELSKIEL